MQKFFYILLFMLHCSEFLYPQLVLVAFRRPVSIAQCEWYVDVDNFFFYEKEKYSFWLI